jgi:thiamine transporter ThiT
MSIELIIVIAVMIAVAVVSFRIGFAAGHAWGLWGPPSIIRLNAAHASSFEAGKRIGFVQGRQAAE